jgi:hypothetical protein
VACKPLLAASGLDGGASVPERRQHVVVRRPCRPCRATAPRRQGIVQMTQNLAVAWAADRIA